MRRLLLILILTLFLVGCEEKEVTYITKEGGAVTVSLSTDKEVYSSSEMMNIGLDIFSSRYFQDVKIKVYGIYANGYKLDYTNIVDLNEGRNEINFEYKTPSCTGCAGIKEGKYDVYAELWRDNEMIGKDTITIKIES